MAILIAKKNFLYLNLYLFENRRSSIGTFMRSSQSSQSEERTHKQKQQQSQPKLDYRSMVSIDDMPALFVSFDSKFYLFLRIY